MCKCDSICVTVFIDPCEDMIDTTIPSTGADELVVFFDGVGHSYPIDGLTETIVLPKYALNENYKHRAVLKMSPIMSEFDILAGDNNDLLYGSGDEILADQIQEAGILNSIEYCISTKIVL